MTKGTFVAEGYYIQQLLSSVMNNSIFYGMGIYFEPYAFDANIKNYAIYIEQENLSSTADKSYAFLEDYAKEKWYIGAIEKGS